MPNNFDATNKTLISLRQGRLQSERSGEYWGDTEREQLKLYFLIEGRGISEIALLLQRSENAVIQQLIAMDLLTPPGRSRMRSAIHKCRCPECKTLECPHYREGYCYAGNV